jgi:phospholipase/carboxylesterase
MVDPEHMHLGVPLAEARVICVFVHGRGQSPEAMEDGVIRHLSTPGVSYVLPRAPGGIWYTARAVDALTDDSRAALGQSVALLRNVIAAARAQAPGVPVLLGGFSQGACLSLELAFADGPWPGALVALTGCRVGQQTDVRARSNLNGMPVYLTGGDADPWISVQAFAEAAADLGLAQARLRADVFPGRGHEASKSEIDMLDAMLNNLATGRAAIGEQAP